MKVVVLKGVLSSRDAELEEIPKEFFKEAKLSSYQKSAHLKVARQEGAYRSRQGATITPAPLWSVEFQTIRRKGGTGYQILPMKEDELYVIKTARWASEVVGTGTEKEKWRGLSISDKCSLDCIFAVATSAWLVPFAIAHRYLVHIPAEIKGTGRAAKLSVRHDFAQYKNTSLQKWLNQETETSLIAIKNWTAQAQKAWKESKTDKSPKLVTERLDYQGTLSSQMPRAYRVVHTRSRSFYAAVLNPRAKTVTGLPFDSAKLQTTEGGGTIKTLYVPIGGVICDNLLHSIVVDSKEEAYWMMGLFNSQAFGSLV